jgi:hypothetical protein
LCRLKADALGKKAMGLSTEPPPTKVEGFSGLERLRRTVEIFSTEIGGFKPDFWKVKAIGLNSAAVISQRPPPYP